MRYVIRYRAPIAPAAVLTRNDIVDDSLRMSSGQIFNSPSSVIVQYMPSTGTAEPWVPADATQQLAGVDTGDIPDIESTIELHGIRRATEALRKARHRLVRLQYQGRYTWQAYDAGIKFQRGDVVQLPNMLGLMNQWVRILNVTLATYGLYNVEAEHYDPAMYSDELAPVGPDGEAPVGLIVPYTGSVTPGGWEIFSEADGLLLVGAGGEYDVNEIGGSEWTEEVSGTTNVSGAHSDTSTTISIRGSSPKSGAVATARVGSQEGAHAHNFTIPAFKPDLPRRCYKLIKKIDESSVVLPPGVEILGRSGIYAPGIQQIMAHNNRYICASDTAGVAGTDQQSVFVNIASASNAHRHTSSVIGLETMTNGSRNIEDNLGFGGGDHTHNVVAPLQPNLKSAPVVLYGSGSAFTIKPGFIGMWDGDIGDIPEEWHLCNGENGTINIVDMFPLISDSSERPAFGDGSLLIPASQTSSVGHTHNPGSNEPGGIYVTGAAGHATSRSHSHIVSASIPWTPPYYAIYFIMYMPNSVEE